jgi:hypothetical protein
MNILTIDVYTCQDNTEGAAVWKRISESIDDILITITGELIIADGELVHI